MFVCCECCVLSGRGLCDELITRPEESYRVWYVVVCDLETSGMRRPWPTGGCYAKNKKKMNKCSFSHLLALCREVGRKVYELEMANCCGFNLQNCVTESLTKSLQFLKVKFCLHITEFRIYVNGERNCNIFGYALSLTETALPLKYCT
jgi:hypothetical protein